MAREIKFRAWLPSWEEMDYAHEKSDVEWSWRDNKFVLEIYHDDGFCWGMQEFENVKIMQYTGLTDKNGKEIYEGDVIKYESVYGDIGTKKVDFEEGMFCVSHLALAQLSSIEILGNIYENPELI